MTISKSINGTEFTIALKGRLDTVTSPDLEKEIRGSIEGISLLILDFAELDYLSSAGLRVLLAAQKVMAKQGEMKVINVDPMIMSIFDTTGFTDILTIA